LQSSLSQPLYPFPASGHRWLFSLPDVLPQRGVGAQAERSPAREAEQAARLSSRANEPQTTQSVAFLGDLSQRSQSDVPQPAQLDSPHGAQPADAVQRAQQASGLSDATADAEHARSGSASLAEAEALSAGAARAEDHKDRATASNIASTSSPAAIEASTPAGIVTAKQEVEDPFLPDASGNGSADVESNRAEGKVGEVLRGHHIIRKMQNWQEMGKWLLKFDSDQQLFPTEISRIWTQIVEVRTSTATVWHALRIPENCALCTPEK
jgi:hypothetical protein